MFNDHFAFASFDLRPLRQTPQNGARPILRRTVVRAIATWWRSAATTMVLLSLPIFASAQSPLAGRWEGFLEGPADRQALFLTFTMQGDGLSGRIDLPEAGALGVPLRAIRFTAPEIQFELPTERGALQFEGRASDTLLLGSWAGLGIGGKFRLARASAPLPPYRQEEVQFESRGGVRLAGTLLTPVGVARPSAIVFIHGSGASSRVGFQFFADYYARHGIAALTYDKRGVGGSTGDWERATFDDLANDALAAVRLLKARRDIGPVGLQGHSQGGRISFVAAAHSPEVSFIITVSGGLTTPVEQELIELDVRLRARGFPDSVLERAQALRRMVDEFYRTGERRAELQTALAQAKTEPWFPLTTLRETPIPESERCTSWWHFNMDFDPLPAVERTHVPVLAIFGQRDQEYMVTTSRGRLEVALAKSPANGRYRILIFPNADHTLRVSAGFLPRLAPGLLDSLVDWIKGPRGPS